MATPSGATPDPLPAGPPDIVPKAAPDKKKLFIPLGLAGLAVLGVGGYLLMNGRGGDNTTEVASTPTNAVEPGAGAEGEGGPTGGMPNQGIPPAGMIPVNAVGNPSTLLPLSPYRRDPFVPFVIAPVPLPLPPPAPTPKPPPKPRPTPTPEAAVPLPQPADAFELPQPGGGGGGGGLFGGGAPAPGFAVPGANNSGRVSIDRPLILPTVVIPRLNATRTAPTNAFPPPRSSSGAGSDVASPSFNKRLSGVVIGNGVRAVLEISGGATPKSYVVQPGDVVEGITILNIQRFNEGGTQVTRMLIRENGGERTVDLKPGPPRTAAGGEFGGPGGEGFGGPGGFPGGGGFGGRGGP